MITANTQLLPPFALAAFRVGAELAAAPSAGLPAAAVGGGAGPAAVGHAADELTQAVGVLRARLCK